MSFHRLAETVESSIVLANAFETCRLELLTRRELRLALKGLHHALGKMGPSFTVSELIDEVVKVLVPSSNRLQVCGNRAPLPTERLFVLRDFSDIQILLGQILKVHKYNRAVKNALAPSASDNAMIRAADAINEYSPLMGRLVLSGPYNIFFATRLSDAIAIETRSPFPADGLRDALGLVQTKPVSSAGGKPLFAFEAKGPISTYADELRIARPTTIEGFNNLRFRQCWPSDWPHPQSHGKTVQLGHTFGTGLPEWVATGVPLRDNFLCRFVGRVRTFPQGTDATFLQYIDPKPTVPLADMATYLDQRMRSPR